MPSKAIARALGAENLQPGDTIGLKALCQKHGLSVSRMADFMRFRVASTWIREELQKLVTDESRVWLLDVKILQRGSGRYRSWVFKRPYPGEYGILVEALNTVFKRRKSPITYLALLDKVDSMLVDMYRADMKDKVSGPQLRLYLLEFGYRCMWEKAKQHWMISPAERKM